MKTLLLGVDGQLGNAFTKKLPTHWELFSLGKKDLDLERLENIFPTILKYRPELIINCAAYTQVDAAETEQNKCEVINSLAVNELAKASKILGARLIHFSTDYVFDGRRTSPYTEEDKPNPLSQYGKTKLAGEFCIIESGCEFLIFRTSWVFAKKGNNFVNKIDQLLKEKTEISIVNDQFGSPTSANFIAETVVSCLLYSKLSSGIYNVCSAGHTSWFGLAQEYMSMCIKGSAGLSEYQCKRILGVPTSEYRTAAVRPKNSNLYCGKLFDQIKNPHTSWQEQLRAEFFGKSE